jgi:hypothetical protein
LTRNGIERIRSVATATPTLLNMSIKPVCDALAKKYKVTIIMKKTTVKEMASVL